MRACSFVSQARGASVPEIPPDFLPSRTLPICVAPLQPSCPSRPAPCFSSLIAPLPVMPRASCCELCRPLLPLLRVCFRAIASQCSCGSPVTSCVFSPSLPVSSSPSYSPCRLVTPKSLPCLCVLPLTPLVSCAFVCVCVCERATLLHFCNTTNFSV